MSIVIDGSLRIEWSQDLFITTKWKQFHNGEKMRYMYSKTLELLSCGFKPSLICQPMKNIKVKN